MLEYNANNQFTLKLSNNDNKLSSTTGLETFLVDQCQRLDQLEVSISLFHLTHKVLCGYIHELLLLIKPLLYSTTNASANFLFVLSIYLR